MPRLSMPDPTNLVSSLSVPSARTIRTGRLRLKPSTPSCPPPSDTFSRCASPNGVKAYLVENSTRWLSRSWLLKYEPELTSGARIIGPPVLVGSTVLSKPLMLTEVSRMPPREVTSWWVIVPNRSCFSMVGVTGCGLNVSSPA